MRGRDEAVTAVRARLDRVAADQDPAPVLGDDALADAGALAAAADPAADLEAAYLLGMFGWFRYGGLGRDGGQDVLAAAVLFLVPVFASDPGAVPEPLHPACRQAGGPDGEADRDDAAGRAGELFCEYQDTGQLSPLWEAVMLFRAASTAAPAGDLGRCGYLSGLGGALHRLAERTADVATMEKAVEVHRAAVAAAPAGHPGRAGVLSNFGAALEKLAARTGDVGALDEAIGAHQAAVAATRPGDRYRALCLSNLGNALHVLAERTGDVATLQQAVQAHRAAVDGTPAGTPGRAARQSNLGTVLESLFERTGSAAALEEAAEVIRAAIADTPAGQPSHAGYLSNLGAALQRLFDRTMDTAWLAEAVDTHQAAVEATPADHPDRGRRLSNLGATLRALAERIGSTSTLEEAVSAHRAAVEATPADHPDRGRRLSSLGNALRALAERTGSTGTLEEAVTTYRAAVEATPASHPDHGLTQAGLSGALQAQASRIPEPSARARTLAGAVRAGRAAAGATPAGHPDRAMYLDNLGTALHELYGLTGDAATLAEAGRCLAGAAGDASAPPVVRVSAYRGLARLPGQAGMSPRQLLAAMETAARLLPQIAPSALHIADRQYSLSRLASVAGLAAAAAVSAGRPGRAVELLEQTRGILVAGTLDARSSDLSRLRSQAPRLAREFEDLRARIDALGSPSSPGSPPDPDQLRRDADAAWEDLLARIRAVSGFETFLRAPGVRQLARQARDGPVIFLYASPSRCGALLLTAGRRTPVRMVPLPGLTEDDAGRQAGRLLRARQTATSSDASLRDRRAAHAEILGVLAWTWETITGPVLAALGYSRTPDAGQAWPRVWWCPVGILAYLPLHAAGLHDDTAAGRPDPRAVMDRVISSYITTIRGLGYARSQHPAPGPALIIAVSAAPGAPPLDGAAAEADVLASLIPGAQVLYDPDREEVLRVLPHHPVAHFTCHGYADWADPAASRLLLPGNQDRPLTVADISALRLPGSLAYLSACDTAVTSPRLADEAIHITGAFHLAGYPHVIGTLWPIYDATGRDLARGIYRRLTRDGRTPPDAGTAAHALHHAVRQLRDQHPDRPGLWAAHTHTGA